MRTIGTFLADSGRKALGEGSGYVTSDWLPWCELDLKGDGLQVVATRGQAGRSGSVAWGCEGLRRRAPKQGFHAGFRGARLD
jgi:hypothetical protein